LHPFCGFIIAHAHGDIVQVFNAQPRFQVSTILRQAGEFLERRLHPVLWIGLSHLAFVVHMLEREVAGSVVVQVRIEMLAVKDIQPFGMLLGDVTVAQECWGM